MRRTLAQYRDCIARRQVQYDPGMPVNGGDPLQCDNRARLLARARRQPDAVDEIEERAMLAVSPGTQSIQEDYIRGQGQLNLPGAEVVGRRIIGMLVSEFGPK